MLYTSSLGNSRSNLRDKLNLISTHSPTPPPYDKEYEDVNLVKNKNHIERFPKLSSPELSHMNPYSTVDLGTPIMPVRSVNCLQEKQVNNYIVTNAAVKKANRIAYFITIGLTFIAVTALIIGLIVYFMRE